MITFNNIVSKFEEFCTNHFFIKTFSYGSPSDVDLDKFEDYPLLHLVYTGGDYNSPKAKTYNLEVYILSLPPSKADKVDFQRESISDAEQVAEDILADIENGGNIFQFGFHYDLINASVTPLEEEQSNALAGCLLDIAISVPYTYDSCNAPLTGVEPEGTPPTAYKARGLLRVKELDGSPDVLSVATIKVPNGSLTDDGDGEITLAFGGALPSGVEGQTLVYQSGAWVAGFPISAGQVTQFKRTSNAAFTQSIVAGGSTLLEFGTFLAGGVTYDNEIRAGAAFGFNNNANLMQMLPVSVGSTIQVELEYEITLDSAGLAAISSTVTGAFSQVGFSFPNETAAGTVSRTITSNTADVVFFSTTNTIKFQVLSTVAGTWNPTSIKIIVNHA